MKIQTLFFGITSDLVETNDLEITISENSSINDFKVFLKKKYPKLENINSYAIAVNETYAEGNLILKEGDVVAIIPPVSGG
ncbi:MoaD/ThiS family protein [Polaribacter aestuariivivens]|uniref:Molybdopterin synthase sulfur carrier subunit n=1 Tax=Polaribacter aestuariivivens TaxID=2304626 RepID=A0A5S3N589_9FLAO|nr:MoaD/ThiS family protein [Polaribacter aestuariivivens]TMM30521.1 MoaD/ThiS family protein [Polaribacter aestuariivivens]